MITDRLSEQLSSIFMTWWGNIYHQFSKLEDWWVILPSASMTTGRLVGHVPSAFMTTGRLVGHVPSAFMTTGRLVGHVPSAFMTTSRLLGQQLSQLLVDWWVMYQQLSRLLADWWVLYHHLSWLPVDWWDMVSSGFMTIGRLQHFPKVFLTTGRLLDHLPSLSHKNL